jgi:hypothetical protein
MFNVAPHRLDFAENGYVAFDRDGVRTGAFDPREDLGARGGVAAMHGDPRALGREALGDRRADSP